MRQNLAVVMRLEKTWVLGFVGDVFEHGVELQAAVGRELAAAVAGAYGHVRYDIVCPPRSAMCIMNGGARAAATRKGNDVSAR